MSNQQEQITIQQVNIAQNSNSLKGFTLQLNELIQNQEERARLLQVTLDILQQNMSSLLEENQKYSHTPPCLESPVSRHQQVEISESNSLDPLPSPMPDLE